MDKEKRKEQMKVYRRENLEHIKKQKQGYYQTNKEQIKDNSRAYREANGDKIKESYERDKEKNKAKRDLNREEFNAKRREEYSNNIEKERERNKKRYSDNIEKERSRSKKRREENKGWFNNYQVQRRKNDPAYNIQHRLRVRLSHALRAYSQSGKIQKSKDYGIDYAAIIESLKPFPKDRENYHVDHVIPLCLFDLEDPEQVKKAFAPSNHKWLTIEKNLQKKDRLVHPDFYK